MAMETASESRGLRCVSITVPFHTSESASAEQMGCKLTGCSFPEPDRRLHGEQEGTVRAPIRDRGEATREIFCGILLEAAGHRTQPRRRCIAGPGSIPQRLSGAES